MDLTTRTMTVSASQQGNLLQVTVCQTDLLLADPPVQYGLCLTGEFDEELVLRSIRVDSMEGSKGVICFPATDSLQALVGTGVRNGFNGKAKEIAGPHSCMHFLAMLQQMATMALRCRQIRILQVEGKEAFLRSNKGLFEGKCVGYSA